MTLWSQADRDPPRVYKGHIQPKVGHTQEENKLIKEKVIENELTQKRKLIDSKYSFTLQFQDGDIWFLK